VSALRPDVLTGTGVALAGVDEELRARLQNLGAGVAVLDPLAAATGAGGDAAGSEPAEPGAWTAAHAPLHGLVFDAKTAFGAGGDAGLMAMLEQAWTCVREVATGLIAHAGPGKILLIAPRARSGPMAEAAAAALENLARTVSVEWARHRLTAVAIVPGSASGDAEMHELVAYLLSPAGDYFAGCRLSLGSAGVGATTG
jgi:NAD(P)-dependent dehydrogenase (short-subunit alcohol dehydrogenase family)